jgi:hypothetical protein
MGGAVMKKTMVLLCLITQYGFCIEEPEENVTYPYPFVYDPDNDSNGEEKKSKSKSSEKESKDVWHGKLGKADVTIETKNVDPASQRQAEWDKIRNEHKPKPKKEEKKSKSSFKKDDEEEEEDHSPSVHFRIEWGDD